MQTLVLTGYDDRFKELGDITAPVMESYARRHGFDFYCMLDGAGDHPSWWKMYFLRTAFERYGRVIWMDADILVTNPDVVPPGESGYHCSKDWGVDATESWDLSNCCFVAFPDSIAMVNWVINNQDEHSKLFHEQIHMRVAASDKFKDVITVHHPRVFNAVPIEIHPSVVDPWQPGDWIAHLTMVSLDERIRLAKKMLSQVSS